MRIIGNESKYLPHNPFYLDAVSCSDPSISSDMLLPNNPRGPAKSMVDNLKITVSFNGGAAMNSISLPTHDNILTIKILILLPGEANPVEYMGGLVRLFFLTGERERDRKRDLTWIWFY